MEHAKRESRRGGMCEDMHGQCAQPERPVRHAGREIHRLSHLFKRALDEGMPPEMTGVQGHIIGFLRHNEERAVFQRDIEAEFGIRRPTATGILQLMEKNGLLRREPVEYDARLKRLVLTPKALALHECIAARIRAVEARAVQGVDPGQLEVFFSVLDQVRGNLDE